MKLHFLSAGRIRMRKSIYIQGADRNETFEAPVSSALVRHGQGNLLFDTGCHPSVVEHGEARWGALMKVMTPVMRAEDTLLPNLACLGLVSSCIGRRQSAAQSRHRHGAAKHLECRGASEVVRRNPAHRTVESHRDLRP